MLQNNKKNIKNKSRIDGLNILRFIFFLAILQNHTVANIQISYGRIEFFFVLTGFLLGYLSFIEFTTTGNFSFQKAYFRRALRIYPLYYTVLCFIFFLLPALATKLNFSISLPEKKWYYWLFLSNYEYSDHIFALKFLWSIALSEQLVLLFFILRHFFKKVLILPSIIFILSGSYYMLFFDDKWGGVWNLFRNRAFNRTFIGKT